MRSQNTSCRKTEFCDKSAEILLADAAVAQQLGERLTVAGADDAAQEQDCSGYCVAGPITDNRDGTLSIKMGSYTQLEQALRELEEALA